LRAQERPLRRLEDAALDLFVHQRVRSRAELMARIEAVSAGQVRDAFARMLAAGASVAIAGKVGKGASDRFLSALAAPDR
ncbi:MAG TPA: insulinase family protein, partial [Caldimonas sp.]